MRYLKIYCILFLYIFSCISIVIDFHYCGGELEIVALYHADEDNCCGENENERPDCCHDKLVVVDTDDTEGNKKYVVKNDLFNGISAYSPFERTIVENNIVLEKMVIPINHAPPNSLITPLFIKNRVLLI